MINRNHSNARPAQNMPQMSGEKMNALLGMAGKQLGRDPQQLKNQLESGQISQVLGSLDPQKAAQVQQLLSNPQKLEQLLNSPQVRTMLGGLMK